MNTFSHTPAKTRWILTPSIVSQTSYIPTDLFLCLELTKDTEELTYWSFLEEDPDFVGMPVFSDFAGLLIQSMKVFWQEESLGFRAFMDGWNAQSQLYPVPPVLYMPPKMLTPNSK